MIKSVKIEVIPHRQQRYPTIGDYLETSPGEWTIFVSELGDWRMNMLVGVHELVEVIQTEAAGIPEPDIKAFDEQFEAANKDVDAEPGDQLEAPYHQQHVFAEHVERQLSLRLGVGWDAYDEACMKTWRGE